MLSSFVKFIPIKSIRRKIYQNNEIIKQNEVANYLEKNYIKPFLDGSLKSFTLKTADKDENINTLWQFWAQGKDSTPSLVNACFSSVDKNLPSSYKHRILDINTMRDFIEFPDFVFDKINLEKREKIAAFSDLLRICLLAEFGGVWADSTIFLSGKIDDIVSKNKFFAFTRSKEAPHDASKWITRNPDYFSWDEKFNVRFLSSFLYSPKGHKIAVALKDLLLNYWENEDEYKHYFLFQIFFDLLLRAGFEGFADFATDDDTKAHLLHFNAKKDYDEKLWLEIANKSKIHKLTYYKDISKNSMIKNILQF